MVGDMDDSGCLSGATAFASPPIRPYAFGTRLGREIVEPVVEQDAGALRSKARSKNGEDLLFPLFGLSAPRETADAKIATLRNF
jgi:hypothetical protein